MSPSSPAVAGSGIAVCKVSTGASPVPPLPMAKRVKLLGVVEGLSVSTAKSPPTAPLS